MALKASEPRTIRAPATVKLATAGSSAFSSHPVWAFRASTNWRDAASRTRIAMSPRAKIWGKARHDREALLADQCEDEKNSPGGDDERPEEHETDGAQPSRNIADRHDQGQRLRSRTWIHRRFPSPWP